MKRVLIGLSALFLLINFSFAATPQMVENSSDDVMEELKVVLDLGFFYNDDINHYIPGYGLEIIVEKVRGAPDRDIAVQRISSVLLDYGDTVEGLGENEYISVFFSAFDKYELIVRAYPKTP